MKSSVYLYLFFLIGFTSCRSDRPEEVEPVTSINIQPSKGVFILNEGNFNWSNASIDYFNFSENKLYSDLFSGVNSKNLGDVFQSMNIFNGYAYLVVNNSGIIEVVEPETLKSVATINGMKSPRYIVEVSPSKAYVSDYKSNSVSVIDLSSRKKVKDIACPGWTEEMVYYNNKVFVTNMYKEYIYVINALDDKLEDSIKVGYGSGSIQLDKNSILWVLAGGNSNQSINPTLTKIDPLTYDIKLSLEFVNSNDNPFKLCINGAKDSLFYLNNGVCRMSIADIGLPASPFISANANLFYGLGVEPKSGDVYVADAIDYVQKGKVYRYSSKGNLRGVYDVGIIPNGFYFY